MRLTIAAAAATAAAPAASAAPARRRPKAGARGGGKAPQAPASLLAPRCGPQLHREPLFEVHRHSRSPMNLRTVASPRLTRLRTTTSEVLSEAAMSA